MKVTNLLSSAVKCLQLQGGFVPGPRWGHRPRPPYRLALAIFLAFRFFFLQETNPDHGTGDEVCYPRLPCCSWRIRVEPEWCVITLAAGNQRSFRPTQVHDVAAPHMQNSGAGNGADHRRFYAKIFGGLDPSRSITSPPFPFPFPFPFPSLPLSPPSS